MTTTTRDHLRTAVGEMLSDEAGRLSHHPYLDTIFSISDKYLRKTFDAGQLTHLRERCYAEIKGDRREVIEGFIRVYYETVKQIFQDQHAYDRDFDAFVGDDNAAVKLVWGDCLDVLRRMRSESVQLMVTSPPYYNAREYSTWPDLDAYLDEMRTIIAEAYRVLDNHRPFVFNVGDIFDNDHRQTRSTWGKRRIPLGAYFTQIFEDVGFQFVDDFIWDKGEVQSQRHKHGNTPFPLYQYPVNCYEHIFVFYKHRMDETLYPCPICGCLKVNGNAYSGPGIKSWECKNLQCTERSLGNRGKRFSVRHQVMTELQTTGNLIPVDLLTKWRRDVVQITPVIKINSKGENIIGHTAPFPSEIPSYAVRVFTGVGETVMDPFAGSFTTAIEAVKLGRIGVGVELNRSMFRSSILSNMAQRLMEWEEYSLNAR